MINVIYDHFIIERLQRHRSIMSVDFDKAFTFLLFMDSYPSSFGHLLTVLQTVNK